MTAMLGYTLLVALVLVTVTGFLSHSAYEPGLGRNAIVPRDADLPTIPWPAGPWWLYAATQGIHVSVGYATVPLVLAKLWSVIPRLFAWPPVTSPAQAIERASLALLIGSIGFELASGIANAQYWYPFGFNFVVAHYYGAVVFTAALLVHLVVKLPVATRALRARGGLAPLRESLAETRPEPGDPHGGLVASAPAAPTITRRGVLGIAGAGSLLLLVANAGQSIGGPLRPLAFLAPRRQDLGSGANDFQVNKTARQAGITPAVAGDGWRLELAGGPEEVQLTRAELEELPQHSAALPIACVEGWSVRRTWTGVPLAALAERAGVPRPSGARVISLQERGVLREATLDGDKVEAEDAMLALRVEGEDLSLDHGYPARIIVPALPGVHCTKWVSRIEFRA
jgi:DMSO/TMAO reductase YedYZ molybdopterin-dependent catalytic subunit